MSAIDWAWLTTWCATAFFATQGCIVLTWPEGSRRKRGDNR